MIAWPREACMRWASYMPGHLNLSSVDLCMSIEGEGESERGQ